MPIATLIRPALLVSVAVTALAACQVGSPAPNFDYGQGLVETCAAEACTTLGLDYAPLADYAQLNALSHVTSLMVAYTDFGNLGDIAEMGQLRELHLGNTRVRDLSGLANFRSLNLIHMQGVQPADWTPLTQISGLRELAVGYIGMTDLSFIAQMPRLQRLYLAQTGAHTDLSTLGRHPGLRAVHIDDEDVADLSPLLNLPNLRQVSIEHIGHIEQHDTVIAQLRARGVTVELEEVLVPVC